MITKMCNFDELEKGEFRDLENVPKETNALLIGEYVCNIEYEEQYPVSYCHINS